MKKTIRIRALTLLLVLFTLLGVFVIAAPTEASGAYPHNAAGTRISMWSGPFELEKGEPFHIMHGMVGSFGGRLSGLANRYDLKLYVDDLQVGPPVNFFEADNSSRTVTAWWLYNFRKGTQDNNHKFTMKWYDTQGGGLIYTREIWVTFVDPIP